MLIYVQGLIFEVALPSIRGSLPNTWCFKTLVFLGVINFLLFCVYIFHLVCTPLKCYLNDSCRGFQNEVTYGDFLFTVAVLPIFLFYPEIVETKRYYGYLLGKKAGEYEKYLGEKASLLVGVMNEKIQAIIFHTKDSSEQPYDEYVEELTATGPLRMVTSMSGGPMVPGG